MAKFAWLWMPLAAGLCWIVVVLPALCRLFGSPLPINWRERKVAIRKWSIRRYLWLRGVLGFEATMALMLGLKDSLEWRQSHYRWQEPSLIRLLIQTVMWLAFGAFWGWLTWDEEKDKKLSG